MRPLEVGAVGESSSSSVGAYETRLRFMRTCSHISTVAGSAAVQPWQQGQGGTLIALDALDLQDDYELEAAAAPSLCVILGHASQRQPLRNHCLGSRYEGSLWASLTL